MTSENSESDKRLRKYAIRSQPSREQLVKHLKAAVTIAFEHIPKTTNKLRDELRYLDEVLMLLAKENHDTLLIRERAVQNCLNQFFDLMAEIRAYSLEPRSFATERRLQKSIRKLVAKLTAEVTGRLSSRETAKLEWMETSSTVAGYYCINLRRVSAEFHSIFNSRIYEIVQPPKDLTAHKIRLILLNKFSPELVIAYNEADSLLDEAEGMATTADEEHFIEQVTEDYYPHIFDALQRMTQENADFTQKETVVAESIKQFKIIQLGLHKIIDEAVVRNMNTMKSQTDFLRNKVLGPETPNLSQNEIELRVDTSVEEAQRLREELYKKHVAPQIQSVKEEHEAVVAVLRMDHEMQMKELTLQNLEQQKQIAELEAKLSFLSKAVPEGSPYLDFVWD